MAVFLLGFGCTSAAGEVIYVDADASTGGDGTTWPMAYKYLQDALAYADSNPDVNEIWVAEGTYYPDEDEGGNVITNDRTETFQLISGVEIYGGFAGGGHDDPNVRLIHYYETILSGDIDVANDNSDNSYHVVTGSWTDANAVLDGFTVTAGNANGPASADKRGGGMYNRSGSPTVNNCTFSANSAAGEQFRGGGGMYNRSGSPTVNNCTFRENSVGNYGGGISNYNSSPTITNCTFSGNSAAYGGGMYTYYYSSPTVTNCTFSGNSASINGGGMYNLTYSAPNVTNCILWGNDASQIYNDGTSSATVSYSDVQGGYDGTGNIGDDPLFVDANGLDGIPGTADDEDYNVHLSLSSSPCFNAGDPGGDYSSQVDVDGQPRVAYGRVDMGADEVCPIAADFDHDCNVNMNDLEILGEQWLLEKLSMDLAPIDEGDSFVDFLDWAVFANAWQSTSEPLSANWNEKCDVAPDGGDGIVDIDDLAVFVDQWLQLGRYDTDIAPVPDGDGIINLLDFAVFAENWLLSVE